MSSWQDELSQLSNESQAPQSDYGSWRQELDQLSNAGVDKVAFEQPQEQPREGAERDYAVRRRERPPWEEALDIGKQTKAAGDWLGGLVQSDKPVWEKAADLGGKVLENIDWWEKEIAPQILPKADILWRESLGPPKVKGKGTGEKTTPQEQADWMAKLEADKTTAEANPYEYWERMAKEQLPYEGFILKGLIEAMTNPINYAGLGVAKGIPVAGKLLGPLDKAAGRVLGAPIELPLKAAGKLLKATPLGQLSKQSQLRAFESEAADAIANWQTAGKTVDDLKAVASGDATTLGDLDERSANFFRQYARDITEETTNMGRDIRALDRFRQTWAKLNPESAEAIMSAKTQTEVDDLASRFATASEKNKIDKMFREHGDILANPNDISGVLDKLRRDKTKALGIGKPGFVGNMLNSAATALKEAWLPLNAAYHMANFTDNAVKAALSGVSPRFGGTIADEAAKVGVNIPDAIAGGGFVSALKQTTGKRGVLQRLPVVGGAIGKGWDLGANIERLWRLSAWWKEAQQQIATSKPAFLGELQQQLVSRGVSPDIAQAAISALKARGFYSAKDISNVFRSLAKPEVLVPLSARIPEGVPEGLVWREAAERLEQLDLRDPNVKAYANAVFEQLKGRIREEAARVRSIPDDAANWRDWQTNKWTTIMDKLGSMDEPEQIRQGWTAMLEARQLIDALSRTARAKIKAPARGETWQAIWQARNQQSMDLLNALEKTLGEMPDVRIPAGEFIDKPFAAKAAKEQIDSTRGMITKAVNEAQQQIYGAGGLMAQIDRAKALYRKRTGKEMQPWEPTQRVKLLEAKVEAVYEASQKKTRQAMHIGQSKIEKSMGQALEAKFPEPYKVVFGDESVRSGALEGVNTGVLFQKAEDVSKGKISPKPAVSSESVAAGAAQKQPWEMTQLEFSRTKLAKDMVGKPISGAIYSGSAKPSAAGRRKWFGDQANRIHEMEVRKAISEGKPVSAVVRADYYDLAAKAKPEVPVQPVAASEAAATVGNQALDRRSVNAADLAADYKARGMDRFRAWDQFIIDRALKPEMDAKNFYRVYDQVSASALAGPTVTTGRMTALLRYPNGAERRVRITEDTPQVIRWVDEQGMTGSDIKSTEYAPTIEPISIATPPEAAATPDIPSTPAKPLESAVAAPQEGISPTVEAEALPPQLVPEVGTVAPEQTLSYSDEPAEAARVTQEAPITRPVPESAAPRSIDLDNMSDLLAENRRLSQMERERLAVFAKEQEDTALAKADEWQQNVNAAIDQGLQTITQTAEQQAALREAERIAAQRWRQITADASAAGLRFQGDIFFDYAARTNIDELLQKVSPFTIWQTRNIPWYLQQMLQKPALGKGYLAYQEESDRQRQEGNLPKRFDRTLALGSVGGLGSFLTEREGTSVRGDVLSPFMSVGQQLKAPYEPEGQTDVGKAINLARTALGGVSLYPWVSLPLQAAGVFGNQPYSDILPQSRLVRAATGMAGNRVDPESFWKDRMTDVQGQPAIGTSTLEDYYISKRLSEMAQAGEITQAQAMRAMDDKQDPLWQQAQQAVQGESDKLGALRYFLPVSLKTLTPEDQQIRTAMSKRGEAKGEDLNRLYAANPGLAPTYAINDSPEKRELSALQSEYYALGTPQEKRAFLADPANAAFADYQRYESATKGAGNIDQYLQSKNVPTERDEAILAKATQPANPALQQTLGQQNVSTTGNATQFYQQKQQLMDLLDNYYNIGDEQTKALNDTYIALDTQRRRDWRAQNPQEYRTLQSYWNQKDTVKAQNPLLAAYLTWRQQNLNLPQGESATDAFLSQYQPAATSAPMKTSTNAYAAATVRSAATGGYAPRFSGGGSYTPKAPVSSWDTFANQAGPQIVGELQAYWVNQTPISAEGQTYLRKLYQANPMGAVTFEEFLRKLQGLWLSRGGRSSMPVWMLRALGLRY